MGREGRREGGVDECRGKRERDEGKTGRRKKRVLRSPVV